MYIYSGVGNMSSKMYQLLNPGLPGPSKETISRSTDWTKCIVYFHEFSSVPMSLDIQRLDESNGVASTIGQHNAKWHTSCHVQFNKTETC